MANIEDKKEKIDMPIKMGAPKKYKTVTALRKRIEHYFNTITITVPRTHAVEDGYKDKEKKKPKYRQEPSMNNAGEQIQDIEYIEKPSILGLCNHLKITRATLINMESNPIADEDGTIKQDFLYTITQAREKIVMWKASQLYRTQGSVNGIVFDLKCNHGWIDKTEVVTTNLNITEEVESHEEALAIIEAAKKSGMI